MIPLKVTHVTTSIYRLGGGLFESVRHLSRETSQNGIEIEVLGTQDQYSDADRDRWAPLQMRTFPRLGPQRFAYSPGLACYLADSGTDMVHLHGLWQYPSAAVLRWARATGKPYIVSAHGMLEPWALQHSRFKKAVVNWLYGNACLREAACLRATAASEVESYRRLGLKNPIALIPNGVPVPGILPPRAQDRNPKARRKALFMSRIHPKKGLLNLVQAWAKTAKIDKWELVLMGPDEGGHLAQVMNLVRECGMQAQIRYDGEIWEDDAKWKCYSESDLFILPSYSENFGLVIAEALGCGVPVITTRATPWEELETHRCGWWIDTGEEPLVQALRQALEVPGGELLAMGLRGRQLIQEKYCWAPIGKQMAETYEWLAGRRSRPEYVT